MKTYKIIFDSTNIESFEAKLNKATEQGFELSGNLIMHRTQDDWICFAQLVSLDNCNVVVEVDSNLMLGAMPEKLDVS